MWGEEHFSQTKWRSPEGGNVPGVYKGQTRRPER